MPELEISAKLMIIDKLENIDSLSLITVNTATVSIKKINNKTNMLLFDSKTYFKINPTPISCRKVLMLAIIKSFSSFNSFHFDNPAAISIRLNPKIKSKYDRYIKEVFCSIY